MKKQYICPTTEIESIVPLKVIAASLKGDDESGIGYGGNSSDDDVNYSDVNIFNYGQDW